MKKQHRNIIIVSVIAIILIVGLIFIARSRADLTTSSIEVEVDTELKYYLKLKYDGKDKFGVESDGTSATDAYISSDIIHVEDVIPEGLTFVGFVPTSDGTIGASLRSDNTISCPGEVIDDTNDASVSTGTWNQTNTEYTYHGLHYTTNDRTVRFRVKNLKAGCDLTVGIITRTPATIDDPLTTNIVELRRDFYNHAIGRERDVITRSNTVHAYMGTGLLYKVKYAYSGTGPSNMNDLLPGETEYAENASVRVAPNLPTIDGYDFNGWVCVNDTTTLTITPSNGVFTMPASDVTCTGSWTKNQNSYTVTYQLSGITPPGYILPSTKTYYEDDLVKVDSRKAGSVFNGYKFLGWTSTHVTLDDTYEFSMPATNVVITGSFEQVKYTVSYEFLNYSTELAAYLPAPVEYSPGATVTLPTIVDPTGYHFLGWYKEDNFTMPEQNIVVQGEWMVVNNYFEPVIVKTITNASSAPFKPGDTINYKISITNNESFPIKNVQIKENNENIIFPVNTTLYTRLSEHIIEIPVINANSTYEITFNHIVTTLDTSPLVNEVELLSALADNNNYIKEQEYKSSVSTDLVFTSELQICKYVTGTMPNINKKFDYIITDGLNTYNISLAKDTCKKLIIETPGTYNIKEILPYDYDLVSVTGSIPANGRDLYIVSGGNYQINFTNTFRRKGFWHGDGRRDNIIIAGGVSP